MEYKIITSYKIIFQIRRKGNISIWQGDWQDKEVVILGGDDATEIVNEMATTFPHHDFRLKGVEIIGQVDAISLEILAIEGVI